jgi:hypothetical protein
VVSGSLNAQRRFELVQQFNQRDSLVDVLLLTTHVGGLGLNLTAADTVSAISDQFKFIVIFSLFSNHPVCVFRKGAGDISGARLESDG